MAKSHCILVLAPHPDDEVLGCGGAICQHVANGDVVHAVFLTSGELGLKSKPKTEAWRIREQEALVAGRLLGLTSVEFLRGPDWELGQHQTAVAKELRAILGRLKPVRIYLPHPHDAHPDHQATFPILKKALSRSRIPMPELLAYEVWTPLTQFDEVVDLTSTMGRKLAALQAHASQLTEFDYARAIEGLNRFRGILAARCAYAEVFQSLSLPPSRARAER